MLVGTVERINVDQSIGCMRDNKEVEGGKVDWDIERVSIIMKRILEKQAFEIWRAVRRLS